MLKVEEPGEVCEVEVKYWVREPVRLVEALATEGVRLGEAFTQDDQAYAPASWSYGQSKVGVAFARLRTQDGQHLFTVKVPQANELACLESETVVDDRGRMHGALLLMGWTPTVRIVKTRRTAEWGDTCVCIDDVDGLGTFIEVEQIVRRPGIETDVQDRLDAMVQGLGVGVERVTATYDSLLRATQVHATQR